MSFSINVLAQMSRVLTGMVVALSVLPAAAIADVSRALQSHGWDEVTFSRKTPNQFVGRADGSIEISSEGSVSLLKMPVMVDLAMKPMLNWRWRVSKSAPATDLSIKGDDDRSLAVYAAFPFVPEEATIFERLQRKIVEKTIGKDTPGRVLIYVWGGLGERGDLVPSPHMGQSAMMKILRPGTTRSKQWFDEQIDIAEDYRNAFGSEPPDPMYIAVSADTDDTGGIAQGVIVDLEFRDQQGIL